jgi:hypothetical protein
MRSYLPVLEQFTRSTRLIYKRLAKLDASSRGAARGLRSACQSELLH